MTARKPLKVKRRNKRERAKAVRLRRYATPIVEPKRRKKRRHSLKRVEKPPVRNIAIFHLRCKCGSSWDEIHPARPVALRNRILSMSCNTCGRNARNFTARLENTAEAVPILSFIDAEMAAYKAAQQ